jgi:hypothetical protein
VAKQQQQDGKEEAELVEIPGSTNLEKPVGESAAASTAAAWAASADGSIRCPPVSQGGCGQCQLSLKTLFEHNWIAKLTMDAEMECYNAQTEQDASRCSICDLCGGDVKKKFLRLAAHRKGENDNYLYCPSQQNIEDVEDKDSGGLAHFQKHWVQGEPIIVCNVLEAGGGRGLSWEPMVVWRAVRETTKKKLERKTVAAIDCLNWQEVKKWICSRDAAWKGTNCVLTSLPLLRSMHKIIPLFRREIHGYKVPSKYIKKISPSVLCVYGNTMLV